MDEVFIKMNGVQHYLWRAVDQNGTVIEILVQPRRDHWAALRSFRKLRISEPWRNVGRSRVAYSPTIEETWKDSGISRLKIDAVPDQRSR